MTKATITNNGKALQMIPNVEGGEVVIEPGKSKTGDFSDEVLLVLGDNPLLSVKEDEKRGPGRPPKDPLDHDADGRKGGAKPAAE